MKRRLIDLAERAGWTFVQAFAAALTLDQFTQVEAVKLAAVAGGYAVLKYIGVVASNYLSKPDPNLTGK